MVGEKILLVWQQSWYAATRIPLITCLSLVARNLQRFYGAFFTTYSFLIFTVYAIMAYYVKTTGMVVGVQTLIFSLIIYLMRPSVARKNLSYLQSYFSLEHLTSTLLLIFLYSSLGYILPKIISGIVLIAACCSFCFLYDIAGTIPDRSLYALLRTCYFVIYNGPFLLPLFFMVIPVTYFDGGLLGILLNALFFYPVGASLIMLVYITTLHDNYGLYYAE